MYPNTVINYFTSKLIKNLVPVKSTEKKNTRAGVCRNDDNRASFLSCRTCEKCELCSFPRAGPETGSSAVSPLHSAQISRERPLAAVPGRTDAVAVGLIDRKHVGVVGANRDAAAAKGDREYLHPIHTSAPLKPPGFPHRYVCLRCAEQLPSPSLSLSRSLSLSPSRSLSFF